MGQAEREGSVINFSARVKVDEKGKEAEVNQHLIDMVLLISENNENFKNELLLKLKNS